MFTFEFFTLVIPETVEIKSFCTKCADNALVMFNSKLERKAYLIILDFMGWLLWNAYGI